MASTAGNGVELVRERFARKGRANQVFNKEGSRLVAGGVILNDERTKVLMITAENHKDRWILPKGGIETDEANNFQNAALRECWEEAGVDCRIVNYLGKIDDSRTKEALQKVEEQIAKNPEILQNDTYNTAEAKKIIPKTEFHFYEMKTVKIYTEWPEQHKRERKWCDYETCKMELIKSKRAELVVALEKSAIQKA